MSENFRVLDDRNHVLLRPNIYLGSVNLEPQSGIIDYEYKTVYIVPALLKMVEEVFQNSIDEHIRTNGEFATQISLDITQTLDGTQITVKDNGRGIPQKIIGGKSQPLLAWTELRAGSNFDDNNRTTAGTNGMGAALTCIFSKSFVGYTCDGKNTITVTCSDNMQNIAESSNKGKQAGTQVSFVPDLDRFGLNDFTDDHITVLRDRFVNLAIMYPKIQFKFNGEKLTFKNLKQIAKNFHPDSVSAETDNVSLVFAPAGSEEEFRCLSYVNGIYIKNGGSHVDYVINQIIVTLREHVKKKHKIDVLPNQIRQHILFASWMRDFNALRFDSQTKERITNSVSEVAFYLNQIDFDKIAKQILNTESIINPCIEAILYKKEMAEKLALAKKLKSAAKIRVVNHIAATHSDPEQRSLVITEGQSALGSLITVRDPKKIGGFPLRGKPLNVRDMKPVDILKNKEMLELLTILGLEFGKPATDLNYGKIYVMSDADTDGDSIFCLLLNLFSNWPELFEQGRIYRVMTPLYVCVKGKQTELFYNKTEFDKFNSKGYDVSYCKGLGTLSKDAYRKCINEPYLIKLSANNSDLIKLEMAFGGDANLRKDWMME